MQQSEYQQIKHYLVRCEVFFAKYFFAYISTTNHLARMLFKWWNEIHQEFADVGTIITDHIYAAMEQSNLDYLKQQAYRSLRSNTDIKEDA